MEDEIVACILFDGDREGLVGDDRVAFREDRLTGPKVIIFPQLSTYTLSVRVPCEPESLAGSRALQVRNHAERSFSIERFAVVPGGQRLACCCHGAYSPVIVRITAQGCKVKLLPAQLLIYVHIAAGT